MWFLNSVFGMFPRSVVSTGCHFCSTCNPFIYGLMNKNHRNAMYSQLPNAVCKPKQNKIAAGDADGTTNEMSEASEPSIAEL